MNSSTVKTFKKLFDGKGCRRRSNYDLCSLVLHANPEFIVTFDAYKSKDISIFGMLNLDGDKPKTEEKKEEPKTEKAEEEKGEETSEDKKPEPLMKPDSNRKLKGIMRVGALAKGLLLRGQLNVELVVICAGLDYLNL